MNQEFFDPNSLSAEKVSNVSRRKFFQTTGGLAGMGMLLAACSKSNNNNSSSSTGSVKLGSGDTGILNYAYALEQLEAAFYTQVVAASNFTSSFNSDEQALLTDIRDHEIAHREFFKAALGSSAIIGLTPNFSTIDFTTRTTVLAAAMSFEDLGVSAYNYAGPRISATGNGPTYLLLAGKIVSVEARHAAAIRDMINYGGFTFADTLDSNGLDQMNNYSYVLTAAGKYITNTIDYSQLPA